MSDFTRALAGGVAGAAKATGEVFDDRMKESVDARKQAILAKREESLAKIQHGYRMAEGQAGFDYQDKVREEENNRADTIRKEDLINAQFNKLSDRTAKRAEKEDEYEKESSLWDKRIQGNKDVAEINKKNTVKAIPAAEKKRAQENALDGIQSVISPFEPYFDPQTKTYELNIEGKSQKEIDALMSYIDSKGFQFTGRKLDDKTFAFSLGEFNYDKYVQNKDGATYETKTTSATLTPEENLAQLRSALNKNKKATSAETPAAPRSNLNDQTPNLAKPKASGLAAPITYRYNPEATTTAENIGETLKQTGKNIKSGIKSAGKGFQSFIRKQQGY